MQRIMIGLSIGVAVLLVATTAIVGYLNYLKGLKPDINVVGGTVLVYEIDPTRPKQPDFTPESLALVLQRRLDSAEVPGATVKPLGEDRVEIAIPRSGDHAQTVRQVQAMIARAGELEFLIVANDRNDKLAIDAARKFFEDAKSNMKVGADLAARAKAGDPPPAPENPDAAGPETSTVFDTPLGKFSYSWVEVGKAERVMLGLDNAAEMDPKKLEEWGAKKNLTDDEFLARDHARTWRAAADHRDKGEAHMLGTQLLWSRKVPDDRDLETGDKDKKYEYFVLTRDPEPGKEITGAYLAAASVGVDMKGQPAINFRLSSGGSQLFRDLTSRNRPAQEYFETRLAIVLDGQIMTAPGIRSTISGDGQITGNFTPEEAKRLAAILQGGSLPAGLKPLPVSETAVEPGQGGVRP